jgi:hypothetical protein
MRWTSGLLLTLLSALASVMLPASAQAQITWNIYGNFSDGSHVSGSFLINQYDTLSSASLTTTPGGAFPGFTYTVDNSPSGNGSTYVDFEPGPYTHALQIHFTNSLYTPSINSFVLSGASFECQNSYSCYQGTGGDVRALVSGTAVGHVGSGPEPATWILLLAGLGVVGWRLRRHPHYLPEPIPSPVIAA